MIRSLRADLLLLAAFCAVVAATALSTDNGVVLHFLILTLHAALLSVAWNVLAGFGGQFSFGHAAFFGVGAYAAGVLQLNLGLSAWVALPLAVLAGAAPGAAGGRCRSGRRRRPDAAPGARPVQRLRPAGGAARRRPCGDAR